VSGTGDSRGLGRNLLWLLALLLLAGLSVAVWLFSDELFKPSRVNVVVKVFRESSPAVVSLSAKPYPDRPELGFWGRRHLEMVEEFFRRYLGEEAPGEELNLGTGIIVDPEGFIITNEHVVRNTAWIQVKLADGSSVSGEVWGTEPALDLAVLKVETEKPLPFLDMGSSKDVMIGEQVIVIGNPLGLGHTCTAGIVSALHRTVSISDRVYRDLIQVDAPVNPGNSGGPLLNVRGELIGITTALNPEAEGIGFATPIDSARRVVEDLIKYRFIPSGWLGFSVEALGTASDFTGAEREEGVFVTRVEEDGPAADLVAPGDVILSLAGARVSGIYDFVHAARNIEPGMKVIIDCEREGERKSFAVEAAAFPADLADEWAWWHLGIYVEEGVIKSVTPEGSVVSREGVYIKEVAPGSPAQAWGLSPGDLLLRLNRERIRTVADFRQSVVRARSEARMMVVFKRGFYPPLFANVPFKISGEMW